MNTSLLYSQICLIFENVGWTRRGRQASAPTRVRVLGTSGKEADGEGMHVSVELSSYQTKRATSNLLETFLGQFPPSIPICTMLDNICQPVNVFPYWPFWGFFFSPLRWFLSPCHATYGMSALAGTPTRSRTERTTASTPWGDPTERGPLSRVPGPFAPARHRQSDRSGPLPLIVPLGLQFPAHAA